MTTHVSPAGPGSRPVDFARGSVFDDLSDLTSDRSEDADKLESLCQNVIETRRWLSVVLRLQGYTEARLEDLEAGERSQQAFLEDSRRAFAGHGEYLRRLSVSLNNLEIGSKIRDGSLDDLNIRVKNLGSFRDLYLANLSRLAKTGVRESPESEEVPRDPDVYKRLSALERRCRSLEKALFKNKSCSPLLPGRVKNRPAVAAGDRQTPHVKTEDVAKRKFSMQPRTPAQNS